MTHFPYQCTRHLAERKHSYSCRKKPRNVAHAIGPNLFKQIVKMLAYNAAFVRGDKTILSYHVSCIISCN